VDLQQMKKHLSYTQYNMNYWRSYPW